MRLLLSSLLLVATPGWSGDYGAAQDVPGRSYGPGATPDTSGCSSVGPGGDLAASINAGSASDCFYATTGTHTLSTNIAFKASQRLVCDSDTIITGGKTLGAFSLDTGSIYEITGQTQQGAKTDSGTTEGACQGSAYCDAPENLVRDGALQTQVENEVDLDASGEWWFDYTGNTIKVFGNPSGETVKTTGTDAQPWTDTIGSTISGVTIENCTFELFAAEGTHQDASLTVGTNWVFRDNLIRWNGGVGVKILGTPTEFTRNSFVGNNRYAISSFSGSPNTVILRNRFEDNNSKQYDFDWGAGTVKISQSVNTGWEWIENYHVSSYGAAIWFDIDPDDAVIQGNYIESSGGHGIHVEIMDNPHVIGNIVKNAAERAIFCSSSRDCLIDGNAVWDSQQGIFGVQSCRDEAEDLLQNMVVTNNEIYHKAGTGTTLGSALGINRNSLTACRSGYWPTGCGSDDEDFFDGTCGNEFTRNEIHLDTSADAEGYTWSNGSSIVEMTYSAFKSAGNVGNAERAWTQSGAVFRHAFPYPVVYGYDLRPCPFDLDDDGIVGEAADDCNICDATSGTGVQAADWDGDGTTEGEIYVSASGTDTGTCGGPSDPCATVDYAFANRAGTQAGEDAVCQIGALVATAILDGIPSGDAGSRTISGGVVEYPYDLPTNPTMWICADSDDDGQYAPWDEDDTCTYDNNTSNYVDMGTASDVEIAGIEFDDPADDIFTTVSSTEAGAGRARWYIHDTVWSGAATGFFLFSAGNLPCLGGLTDVTVDNSLFDECDSTGTQFCWLWRGSLNSCGANLYQTLTLRRSTFRDDAVSGEDSWQWFDMWPNTGSSHSRQMQAIENHYECTDDATWCTAGTIAQGESDYFVGYNRAVGVAGFLSLEHNDATFGTGATDAVMTGLKIHGNEVTCRTTDSWCNFMQLNNDSGDVTNNILGSIEIAGNLFNGNDASHATDRATFVYIEAGTDAALPEGFEILIEGNTVYDAQRNGLVWAIDEAETTKYPLTIRNNVFDSASTSEQLFSINYDVAGMVMDYNSYNGGTTGGYDGGSRTLAQMDSLYSLETNSDDCAPAFVDSANKDFRLSSSDTCAKGQATTPTITLDLIGASRGTPYDRGAFAFTVAAPAAATYLRILK